MKLVLSLFPGTAPDLPDFTTAGKFKLIGNAVHFGVAFRLAYAVSHAAPPLEAGRLCACGCGRQVKNNATSSGPACRKRMQRARDAAGVKRRGVTLPLFA